jgi:hypothetical protein
MLTWNSGYIKLYIVNRDPTCWYMTPNYNNMHGIIRSYRIFTMKSWNLHVQWESLEKKIWSCHVATFCIKMLYIATLYTLSTCVFFFGMLWSKCAIVSTALEGNFYWDDVCDVTLSAYPHPASLKNMPDHGGNRTYDLWNTSPIGSSMWYFGTESSSFDPWVHYTNTEKSWLLLDNIDIEGARFCSEISHTRTDQTA